MRTRSCARAARAAALRSPNAPACSDACRTRRPPLFGSALRRSEQNNLPGFSRYDLEFRDQILQLIPVSTDFFYYSVDFLKASPRKRSEFLDLDNRFGLSRRRRCRVINRRPENRKMDTYFSLHGASSGLHASSFGMTSSMWTQSVFQQEPPPKKSTLHSLSPPPVEELAAQLCAQMINEYFALS